LGEHSPQWKVEGREPVRKFRIKGRTDLAVFNRGSPMTCAGLLWAMEVKPSKSFNTNSDVNRALREGAMQLIGMNADNHYTSPSVMVTALTNKHYVLYLERDSNPEQRLQFHLRLKWTDSLAVIVIYRIEELVIYREQLFSS
jgi:hypothetical protein